MKSLRTRLTLWFASGLVLVLVVFVIFTYRLLDSELHNKNWRKDYPDHPDWKLHGSYSEEEIADILKELTETSLLYGLPLALAALFLGYWLARKSVKPIARLNEQLKVICAPNLSRRIELAEMDTEFRDLVRHINELLARLEFSFNDMSEYAAKVAHELRTPLAILRLKLEQAGPQLPPEFAEDLQTELHQLTHVVDQSLLIAKAEQGRLVLKPSTFDLTTLVADVAADFSLLAQEEDRVMNLRQSPSAHVTADFKYTKQIIHSLLANALKHGHGEIRVSIRHHDHAWALTISNRLRSRPTDLGESLGLGLRVVDTLLGLQPSIRCRRRLAHDCYTVRICFEEAFRSTTAPLHAAKTDSHDPHI